jgi:hypothetical protein
MELKDFLYQACEDIDSKEEVIERLANLRIIDAIGLKYYLMIQYMDHLISHNYTIMDATTITAEEYNVSERQVQRVRKWWKSRLEYKKLKEETTIRHNMSNK